MTPPVPGGESKVPAKGRRFAARDSRDEQLEEAALVVPISLLPPCSPHPSPGCTPGAQHCVSLQPGGRGGLLQAGEFCSLLFCGSFCGQADFSLQGPPVGLEGEGESMIYGSPAFVGGMCREK